MVGITAWLAMFVPGWFTRNGAQKPAQARTSIRVATKKPGTAITNIRRVMGVITLTSFGTFVVSLFNLASWAGVAIGAAIALVSSVVVNRVLARRQRLVAKAAPASMVRKQNYYDSLFAAAVDYVKTEAPEQAETREWTPRPMPAPLHAGHIGQLEQPVLAQVSSLAAPLGETGVADTAATAEVSGANLDEILRRRRAV